VEFYLNHYASVESCNPLATSMTASVSDSFASCLLSKLNVKIVKCLCCQQGLACACQHVRIL